MSDLSVARRYARALLDAASEGDAAERIATDLRAVLDTLSSEGGQLLEALANPVFSVEERQGVLGAVLARLDVHPLTANVLKVVADRGRFGSLPGVLEAYQELLDERAGRVRVQVRTVKPLSDALAERVRAAFATATGKEVVLETSLDPSLLGGLVARSGGRVYDASLRTRLEDLKHRLIHAQALPEA